MAKKTKKITTVTTVTEEVSNEKTHVICILDRSGSMASIMSDSIGGFNTFLKQQKDLPDDATITIALFDDDYEVIYDNVDIKKAEELTNKVWFPRGMTALYDAIGKTINTERSNFSKLGVNAPDKVLVVIVTDGLENASVEYKLDAIKSLISDCEKDKWKFIYLAANQDAFAVGTSFGVAAGNTYTYTATKDGVLNMSSKMSKATMNYRNISTTDDKFQYYTQNLMSSDDVVSNTIPNSGDKSNNK